MKACLQFRLISHGRLKSEMRGKDIRRKQILNIKQRDLQKRWEIGKERKKTNQGCMNEIHSQNRGGLGFSWEEVDKQTIAVTNVAPAGGDACMTEHICAASSPIHDLLALSERPGGLVKEKVALCASLFVIILPLPYMWDLLWQRCRAKCWDYREIHVCLLNLGNTFSVSRWSQIVFAYHSVCLINHLSVTHEWKATFCDFKCLLFISRWGFLFYERLWWHLNATDDLQYCYGCNEMGFPTNKNKKHLLYPDWHVMTCILANFMSQIPSRMESVARCLPLLG